MIYTIERFSNKKIALILAIDNPKYIPEKDKYWANMNDIGVIYSHPHLGEKEARENIRFYQFTSDEMLNKKRLVDEVFKR